MKHLPTLVLWMACLLGYGSAAWAQSTLADPYPLQGDQARSIAGTAAVNGALRPGQVSAPERARRAGHVEQAARCRQQARQRSGEARRAARRQCQATLKAQKATWHRG
jgi:hypothetical protein